MKKSHKNCFSTTVLLVLLSITSFSQDCMKIGMNMPMSSNYSPFLPFVDFMKQSGYFFPTCSGTGCDLPNSERDNIMSNYLQFDENGYPLTAIPYSIPGYTGQYQFSFYIHQGDATEWDAPAGIYTLMWDGLAQDGVSCPFGFWGGIKDKDGNTISDTYRNNFTPTATGGELQVTLNGGHMVINWLSSQAGANRVKNIRLIRPGIDPRTGTPFTESYKQYAFNPEFVETFRDHNCIRHMMWLWTTRADPETHTRWEDRTTHDYFTQTTWRGIALEYIIELHNELVDRYGTYADVWYNVPHCADVDRIRRTAQLFRDNLNPDLNIYVEYSNETWNFATWSQPFFWLNTIYAQNVDKYPEGLNGVMAEYEGIAWKTFRTTFGKDSLRIIRVLAGQMANIAHAATRATIHGPNGWDVISPSAYVNMGDQLDEAQAFGSALTGAQLNYYATEAIKNGSSWKSTAMISGGLDRYASFAKAQGKKVVCYEGGQHYETSGLPLQALQEAQNHTASLNTFYQTLIDTFQRYDVDLINFFVSHGNKKSAGWGFQGSVFTPTGIPEGMSSEYLLEAKYNVLRANFPDENLCNPPTVTNLIGPGNAISMDGTNDYIDASSALSAFNPTETSGSYTLETWIKVNGVNFKQSVLSYSNNVSQASNSIFINDLNRICWQIKNSTGATVLNINSSFALKKDKWYHIAAVKNGNNYRIYVNGREISNTTVSVSGTFSYNRFVIGALETASGVTNNYRGQIDEVRVFNTNNNIVQIRDWMCQKISSLHPNYGNLKAYYEMNAVSGTLVLEKINANNATLTNFSFRALSKYFASGAPIGDKSVNIYPSNWNNAAISYTHPSGDRLSAYNLGVGSPDGVHIYMIDEAAFYNDIPKNYQSISNDHYYGVFVANGSNSEYDVALYYNGYTGASSIDGFNRLIKRQNSADEFWGNSGADLDELNTTFSLEQREKERAEYNIGVRLGAVPKRPGAGGALRFDGDDYIDVFPFFRHNDDYTVTLWMKLDDIASGGGCLFSFESDIYGKHLTFSVNGGTGDCCNGRITARFDKIGSQNESMAYGNTVGINERTWNHIAVVKSGINVTVYINGVTMEQLTHNFPGDNSEYQQLLIGKGTHASPYKGLIDEFCLINKALTQDEIREVMCQKMNKNLPYYKDVQTYYNFDEGTGNTLEDRFGRFDADIYGATWIKSGAAIGDISAYGYRSSFYTLDAPFGSASLYSPDGDFLTANITDCTDSWGNYERVQGIQLYRVNEYPEDPNSLPSGIVNVDSTGYWGIFPAAINSNQNISLDLDISYNYTSHPALDLTKEASLRFIERTDNSNATWNNLTTTQNAGANTLNYSIVNGEAPEEFFLAGVSPDPFTFTTAIPDVPVISSGATNVCSGQSGLVYRINPVDDKAESYIWNLPNGITGNNSTTDTIVLNFLPSLTTGSIDISVTAINAYGEATSLPYTINITATPAYTVDISGPDNYAVCGSEMNVNFSIPTVASANSYQWEVPSDAYIIGGQGTNSIYVNFGSISGNVSVNGVYSCGTAFINSMPITVYPALDATLNVSGSSLCEAGTDEGRITVSNSQDGVMYRILNAGTPVDTNIGTGGNIEFVVPKDELTIGANTYTIQAFAGTCGPLDLNKTATINYYGAPDLTLNITGGSACSCGNPTITVENSEPGLVYQPYMYNTGPYGGASYPQDYVVGTPGTGTGSNILLGLDDWGHPTGFRDPPASNEIKVYVTTPGCGSLLMEDTAMVMMDGVGSCVVPSTFDLWNPPFRPISPDGRVICSPTSDFTISGFTNATIYYWGISPAEAGTISGTSSTCTITWAAGYSGSVRVSVQAGNNCGVSDRTWDEVIVFSPSQVPTAPAGTLTRCMGAGQGTYTTTEIQFEPIDNVYDSLEPPVVYYNWTISPAGAGTFSLSGTTTLSGETTANAIVDWNPAFTGTATISAQYEICSYTSVWASSDVVVNANPDVPVVPTGTDMICSSASNYFAIPPVGNATSYVWEISTTPASGAAISGAFTTGEVSWNGFTDGTAQITVYAVGCGGLTSAASPIKTVTLSSTATTAQPAAFTQSTANVCSGASGVVYTVPLDPSVSYAWNYTGTNTTLIGNGNSITMNFASDASGGDLSVTASSTCGTSTPRTISISIGSGANGTLTFPALINSGETADLSIAGYAGTIEKWQYSISPFDTWNDIASTSDNYTSSALSEETWFRVIFIGSCASISDTAQVDVLQVPVIDDVAFTNVTDCGLTDGTISITASGGSGTYEYSSDNGTTWQTENVFTNLLAADYDISIRNSDGTGQVDYGTAISIDQPSAPVIVSKNGTNPSDCNLSDGSITASITSGVGSYECSIDAGVNWQSSPNFSNLSAGTYMLWVRNDNQTCLVDTASPIIITTPGAPVITIVIPQPTSDCGLNDGRISVIATGGNGSMEYSIDNGVSYASATTFIDLTPGNYQVMVRNSDGTCAVNHTVNPVVVGSPVAPNITNVSKTDISACGLSDGSIAVEIVGTSYEFSIDNGSSWLASNVFSNLAQNTYPVSVRNDDGSCATDYPQAIEILMPTIDTLLEISVLENVCIGENAELQLTGSEVNVNYAIVFNGISLPEVSGNGADLNITLPSDTILAGQYVVSVLASSGYCTNISMKDTALLIVQDMPGNAYQLFDTAICQGSSAQLMMSSSELGVNYTATNLNSSESASTVAGTGDAFYFTISNLLDGENQIIVAATNAANCSTFILDTAIIVAKSLPDGSILGENTTCPSGDTLRYIIESADTTYSYIWNADFGEVISADTLNYFELTWLETGISTLEVKLYDPASGCENSLLYAITIDDDNAPFFTICPNDTLIEANYDGTGFSAVISNNLLDAIAKDDCKLYSMFNNLNNTTSLLGYTLTESATATWVAKDMAGNVQECTTQIELEIKDEIKPPTAFSPNNDGINDFWEIYLLSELYPTCIVKVFDRNGHMVFESSPGYPQKWDGTDNGKILPVDSYHYVIIKNGDAKPMKGTLTIIR